MARLLYVLVHSTEAPERTVAGLRAAGAAQAAGHETALWLDGEGVRLGVTAVAETLRDPHAEEAPSAVLERLVAGGATLHCVREAFERREFEPDALREGAALVEADALGALVDGGWVPVPA